MPHAADPLHAHTPDGWRSTGRHSSRRPPPGQRAAGLQVVHLRVEPLVLHQQFADLGLQPTAVFVHGLRRTTLQPRLARDQKLITPLRGPRRRDPQLPRHGLEILSAQQTQHCLALAPGRKSFPHGRAQRPLRSPSAAAEQVWTQMQPGWRNPKYGKD